MCAHFWLPLRAIIITITQIWDFTFSRGSHGRSRGGWLFPFMLRLWPAWSGHNPWLDLHLRFLANIVWCLCFHSLQLFRLFPLNTLNTLNSMRLFRLLCCIESILRFLWIRCSRKYLFSRQRILSILCQKIFKKCFLRCGFKTPWDLLSMWLSWKGSDSSGPHVSTLHVDVPAK